MRFESVTLVAVDAAPVAAAFWPPSRLVAVRAIVLREPPEALDS